MALNVSIIEGNLTRDPQLRTVGDRSVVSFAVAHNKRYKGSDGELKEKTTFVEITAWGPRADTIAQHFSKGSRIIVEGELDLDRWQDQQTGANRSQLYILLRNFHFAGPKPNGDHQRDRVRGADAQPPVNPGDDDEPPF